MKHKKIYLFKNKVFKEKNEPAKTVFNSLGELKVGPAPEFNGTPGTMNPEELFVASVNSCLMTTFFYFVRKSDIDILSYRSDAEGQVEKQADGFRFTQMKIQAKVALKNQELAEKVHELGNLSEKYCLVSRSVTCPVHYDIEVKISGGGL